MALASRVPATSTTKVLVFRQLAWTRSLFGATSAKNAVLNSASNVVRPVLGAVLNAAVVTLLVFHTLPVGLNTSTCHAAALAVVPAL